jgi:phytoene dehydrogenase-like protein
MTSIDSEKHDVPTSADVVIIGAGLAGLAAARHLAAAGQHVVVLESGDDIGGRVSTDVVDGFILDRGFQVIATAYPELVRLIDVDSLDPQPFARGLGVFGAGRIHRITDPREDPAAFSDLLTMPIGSVRDRVNAMRYVLTLMSTDARAILSRPDITIAQAFNDAELSAKLIDRVLRPFLSGVLLEADLTTSRRFVELAIRTMLIGEVIVPARGMRELPRTIAAPLAAGTIITGIDVMRVEPGSVVHSAGTTAARNVIVATDPRSAQVLIPALDIPKMHAVTTLYHATTQAPTENRLLVVDGEQRLIANTVVLSNVAREYAPAGFHLISTSVLGSRHDVSSLDAHVRRRLEHLYATSTQDWDLVAVRTVEAALPSMPAAHPFSRPVRLDDGLVVAGDHRDTSSIQGALVSGRRAAEAVLGGLGMAVDTMSVGAVADA